MKTEDLETRVADLERGLADLRSRLASAPIGTNWIDRMKGCVTDHEAFQEAMEYGRQFRHADRPVDENGESA